MLTEPTLRDCLAQMRLTPLDGSPSAVDRMRFADTAAWVPLIRRLGFAVG